MVSETFSIVSSRVMSTGAEMKDGVAATGVTISFGERFAASDQFDAIFKEGMGLVERTASYLDGPGRREARALRGPMSVLYATESMRLTTRLLELASWLMIRRALKEGEISPAEARVKCERVRLKGTGRATHVKGFLDLPEGLRRLVEASFALNDRIIQLDRAMQVVTQEPSSAVNPVRAQVDQLQEAFAPRRRAGGH
jgi:regulator of CtrA degradation